MAEKVTMFPTKVTQPNRNQPSGLQGKCLSAVQRNGDTYEVDCSYQQDPRYHHEWSNMEEILRGKTIQCGRPSTRFCSHETYYGIKGYRNTCPIAGISGTYTQPATLRVFFDLSKKNISSSAKIEKVVISFEHRCTGVDVADGTETTVWGPNFNGFDKYPNRKAVTVKIGSQTKTYGKNPPLSYKFSNIGRFVFTNVSYNDLVNKGVDIIYGNNLETNPGNIYLRNLTAEIHYTDGVPYIEGVQDKTSLYISEIGDCRSSIKFTIEAGYKQGATKMPLEKAPKNLANDIKVETWNKNIIVDKGVQDPKDPRKKIFTLIDKTSEEGKKRVNFYINGTKYYIKLKYKAKKRNKPNIIIPSKIERNVIDPNVTSIIAKNGCAKKIEAHLEQITDTPWYTFENLNIDSDNIIPQNEINAFYRKLLTDLPCGSNKIYFKRDNEPNSDALLRIIEVTPTIYTLKVTESNSTNSISKYETIQKKGENKSLNLTYIKTKELCEPPHFIIENSTHGKKVGNNITKEVIGNQSWDLDTKETTTTNLDIGTYYPGEYEIKIKEAGIKCTESQLNLLVNIIPSHKQYYDEIFIRGEDSTAFDYDYLVALEGDSLTKPIFVQEKTLGASFDDIKICAPKENISGLTEIKTIDLSIENTSQNEIKNLFLELNTLIENDDEELQVTSREWLESDGVFYNFKENFERFNDSYGDMIKVRNLTKDNDNIDEEDVYLHIENLQPEEKINIKIPYGSSIEKKVYLQILLFGQPIALYKKPNCSDERFDKIPIIVYDSILTDMSITGKTDLFNNDITRVNCPKECFSTSITYNIKNVDTSTLRKRAETLIINDPRLIPYDVEYNGKGFYLINRIPNAIKNVNIIGARIDIYVKFEAHDEIHMYQYTDYQGESLFFINIPQTVGQSFTIEELLKYMSIEFKGDEEYNGYQLKGEFYNKNRSRSPSSNKDFTQIHVPSIVNSKQYNSGQVVPVKIRLEGKNKYMKNEIIFSPDIKEPGDEDSLTVHYEICNLDDNKGKLLTTFKTEGYELIQNEVSKTIYCGVQTNPDLYTKLTEIIVENHSLNRLYLSLTNKDRYNKDVKVIIEEELDVEKYEMINYELDKGTITIEDKKIIWDIGYIDEDAKINGYIDFKAKEVGYSRLKSHIEDFLSNNTEIKFGEESYICECRKVNKND